MALMRLMKRGLERSAPQVYRRLALARWHLRNRERVAGYQAMRSADAVSAEIAEELRRQGIASRLSGEVFEADPSLFRTASDRAHRLWTEARQTFAERGSAGESGAYGKKDYKASLVSSTLPLEDPFVRLALHPRLLDAANRYLGMWSSLRSIELWWDRPTAGPAKDTQLWHKDGDDLLNVKAFIYFNDVDEQTGPFCFIPQTHPLGRRSRLTAACVHERRSTDEQMERVLPRVEWRICIAPAGTVILCDTGGYHKGLKPSHKERLLLMMQYTSGVPNYPRQLQLIGGSKGEELSAAQRQAAGRIG